MADESRKMGDDVTYLSPLDGSEIRSYYTTPRGALVPPPAVLMLRGVAGPNDGYTEIADRLCAAGYAALVHHWQARGNDPDDDTLIADIRGAIAFLKARPDTDAARLAVYGYCKGGGQALIAAAACPEIHLVVAFHGFARRTQGADATHRNPIELVDRVKCPVLLLHGKDDQVSPVAAMRDLSNALERAGLTSGIHLYDGADHGFAVSTHKGFQADAARDSFDRAVSFTAQHLR